MFFGKVNEDCTFFDTDKDLFLIETWLESRKSASNMGILFDSNQTI